MSHLSEEELTILAERERNRAQLPLTNWESLSAQLREEGIIRETNSARRPANEWMLRAAAALILVGGGAVAGRLTVSPPLEPVAAQAASTSTDNGTPVMQVSDNAAASFKSEDEAWDVLNRAGADYQRASAFLAAREVNAPVDSTSVYQARLVALDAMTSASRKALYSAPHDPVINQYYLAAQGAREATLRQLSTSLPTGVKLEKW